MMQGQIRIRQTSSSRPQVTLSLTCQMCEDVSHTKAFKWHAREAISVSIC